MNMERVQGGEREGPYARVGEVREMDGPLVLILLWVGKGSD